MLIKDLEISKELSRKDLSAVRGGSNFLAQGGQFVVGGSGIGNSVAALNAPTGTQTEVAPVTVVDLNTANVIGSFGTLIAQL
jgi:hypothetical protein